MEETNSSRPNIAFVACNTIGDGVISLIMAHNLARNGFAVTFYSTIISTLGEWLPDVRVKPYPPLTDCEKEFSEYDLVLADSTSILAKPHHDPADFPSLAGKYVYISLGKVERELRFDHTERLKATLSEHKFTLCAPLASCAGTIRFQEGDRSLSQVRNVMLFMKNTWHIPSPEMSSGITPPPGSDLIRAAHPRRVMINPFSSSKHKNWPLHKYVRLAEKLAKNGFEPVFAVAPSEKKMLPPEVHRIYPVPDFPSLADLAAYIFESGMMIGNDSGSVHFASALGIPTISITSRGKNHRWRPDMAPGVVVHPLLNIKIGDRRVWKCFLSVNTVYKAFDRLRDCLGDQQLNP